MNVMAEYCMHTGRYGAAPIPPRTAAFGFSTLHKYVPMYTEASIVITLQRSKSPHVLEWSMHTHIYMTLYMHTHANKCTVTHTAATCRTWTCGY